MVGLQVCSEPLSTGEPCHKACGRPQRQVRPCATWSERVVFSHCARSPHNTWRHDSFTATENKSLGGGRKASKGTRQGQTRPPGRVGLQGASKSSRSGNICHTGTALVISTGDALGRCLIPYSRGQKKAYMGLFPQMSQGLFICLFIFCTEDE